MGIGGNPNRTYVRISKGRQGVSKGHFVDKGEGVFILDLQEDKAKESIHCREGKEWGLGHPKKTYVRTSW